MSTSIMKFNRKAPREGTVTTRQFATKLFKTSSTQFSSETYYLYIGLYLQKLRVEGKVKPAYSALNTNYYLETELDTLVSSFTSVASFEEAVVANIQDRSKKVKR